MSPGKELHIELRPSIPYAKTIAAMKEADLITNDPNVKRHTDFPEILTEVEDEIGELIKARHERGITQRELEAMSGVRQPIIARMENGKTTPNVSTVLKVLAPLGKTLYIGDLPKRK